MYQNQRRKKKIRTFATIPWVTNEENYTWIDKT